MAGWLWKKIRFFFPVEVEEGYQVLVRHSDFPVEAVPLARYVHEYYIDLNQNDS